MDNWVETHKDQLPIFCPYKNCRKPVVNTTRYISVTRMWKYNKKAFQLKKSANSYNKQKEEDNSCDSSSSDIEIIEKPAIPSPKVYVLE